MFYHLSLENCWPEFDLVGIQKGGWQLSCHLFWCKRAPILTVIVSVTYGVRTHWNWLYEAIPMCTYNICLLNK